MKPGIKSMIWNIKKQKTKQKKNNQSEQQEEKRIPQNEDSIRILWDNFKKFNIHIMGVPEGEEREWEIENLFEKIMTENVLNLEKEIDIQVQEVQRVPNKMNPKMHKPKHVIVKMPKVKDKERILKEEREKQLVSYKGTPITLI